MLKVNPPRSVWITLSVNGASLSAFALALCSFQSAALAQLTYVSSASLTTNAFEPAISGDGRYVTYVGIWGSATQVFVSDRTQPGTPSSVLLSVRMTTNLPAEGNCNFVSLSSNGRHVAFKSGDPYLISNTSDALTPQIYVLDRDADSDGIFDETAPGARKLIRASSRAQVDLSGNGESFAPSISETGRFVAFHSRATNLVSGDTNGTVSLGSDVFVHDRDADENGVLDETAANARKTIRISVSSAGTQTNSRSLSKNASISATGRYVAFESDANNLVAGDTNGYSDIFVHDRDPDANGVFDEIGTGLRETTHISVAIGSGNANGPSVRPVISSNGRFVAYTSLASNLVSGDTNARADVFVFDRQLSTTRRASVTDSAGQADGPSMGASISADGRFVAFTSLATNLVAGASNRRANVYLFDQSAQLPSPLVRRVGVAVGGAEIADGCGDAALATGAPVLAFTTFSRLVTADSDALHDVYAISFAP